MSERAQLNPGNHSALSRLLENIDCVFTRDPAARSRLEIVLTYPGVHAVLMHRLAHALWRARLHLLARAVSFISRMLTQIDIHPGASIGRRLFIDHGCGVVIGETAVIGDDVTLYHGVTLGGTSWSPGKRHPTLENEVVIGAGAKILGPVRIGRGARIGANSVVIEDVPAQMTAVGVPGRIVQAQRNSHQGQRLALNHHDLPDPVERTMSGLLARMRALELQIAELTKHTHFMAADPVSGENHFLDTTRPPTPVTTLSADDSGAALSLTSRR